MPIETHVKGLVETQRSLQQIVANLHGSEFLGAMRQATLLVTGKAKDEAPVDTGRLRASITPEIRTVGTTIQGVVGSNVTYAPYMELGTGVFAGNQRYFPPPQALDRWAARHNFDSGYQVAYAIYQQGGTKPRRFLQRALSFNKERIRQLLGDAVTRIVRR